MAQEPELPGYVLTVTSCDLLARRSRWGAERLHNRTRSHPTEWRPKDRHDETNGLLVSVDQHGDIVRIAQCDGAQGILGVTDGYLIARNGLIELWDRQLGYVRNFASYPWFNDLHSLRPTDGGVLVAASGTDSITEVDVSGKVSWVWWGDEHGFGKDSFGVTRVLDKSDDHRRWVYDTWLHTTHVNSAVPLDSATILATLFHQGELVAIDRVSGVARTILRGLSRPHAVRWSGGLLTVADTANGHGIVGRITPKLEFFEEYRVDIDTAWLQDWHVLKNGLCVAVDGGRPAVHFVTSSGEPVRCDQFDPNWYVYEVEIGGPH